MKKFLATLMSITLAAALLLTGCGGGGGSSAAGSGSAPQAGGTAGKDAKNIVYVTSSSLGDDPLVDLVWDSVKSCLLYTSRCV